MDWPYHFPHPADESARAAARFRRLSPAERGRAIAEMVELAERLFQTSPRRAALQSRRDAAEEAWRAAHREVFERHGY
jgi:hypothetical protein